MLCNAPIGAGGLLLGESFFISYPYTSMLTIEDGSIVVGADSYNTIADVTAYAARYGLTWVTTDSLANEQAILRAMLYIESLEERFVGYRVDDLQELSFPRDQILNQRGTGYLDSASIPKEIKNAVSEAAILEMATPGILLMASQNETDSQRVVSISKTVDVISKSVTYSDQNTIKTKEQRFERLHAWLLSFLKNDRGRVTRS